MINYTSKLRKNINDSIKNYGNKAYDGLGDILTTEINHHVATLSLVGLLSAGCATGIKYNKETKGVVKDIPFEAELSCMEARILIREETKPIIDIVKGREISRVNFRPDGNFGRYIAIGINDYKCYLIVHYILKDGKKQEEKIDLTEF